MMTDPIADMLSRIRNASRVRHAEVMMPYSKVKHAIAKILAEEGFISGVSAAESSVRGTLTLALKYAGGDPAITEIKRVSTPGKRVYVKSTELPRVHHDFGIAIVSTPRGIMTNARARKEKVGGEVLCTVF